MRIQVLFFAVVRERLGREAQSLELAPGATVGTALEALAVEHPALAPLLPRVQVAVNRQFVRPAHGLGDGDELALIPPVSGGSGAPGPTGAAPLPRRIAVKATPLSLDEVVAAVTGPAHGAVVTFTGHVRRRGQLPEVDRLEYEAYVPMAEEVLTALADELEREQPGVAVAIHHRTGVLAVGELAVAIAVAAPHRAEAFEACRQAIERLKQRAPIWKKEVGADGAVWIGLGP